MIFIMTIAIMIIFIIFCHFFFLFLHSFLALQHVLVLLIFNVFFIHLYKLPLIRIILIHNHSQITTISIDLTLINKSLPSLLNLKYLPIFNIVINFIIFIQFAHETAINNFLNFGLHNSLQLVFHIIAQPSNNRLKQCLI